MKRIIKWIATPTLAAGLLLCAHSSAQAQANFSAGYQWGHVMGQDGGDGVTLPYGWNVDASGAIRPMWAWVGEVGGLYKSESGFSQREHSYQAGVRVFQAVTPTVTPFGQLLIGGVTAGCSGCDSATAFSVQPGAGVDIKIVPRAALRIGADYRRGFFKDEDGGGQNAFRMVFGVVLNR